MVCGYPAGGFGLALPVALLCLHLAGARTVSHQCERHELLPYPPAGWLLLMVFVIFDVILLFWLPTLLASPKTFRLVVPGAVRLMGGR